MFFFFLSGGGRGNNEQVLVNLRTCATSILHENCWWGNNIPEKKNNSKLHSPTEIPCISWPKHVRKRHWLADCYIPQQLEYYKDEVFQHKNLQMLRTTYGVKWWLQVWVPIKFLLISWWTIHNPLQRVATSTWWALSEKSIRIDLVVSSMVGNLNIDSNIFNHTSHLGP